MKKLISLALIVSFAAPSIAIAAEEIQKPIKTKVNKSKVISDDYKYAYINMDWWESFNDEFLSEYIHKAVKNNHDLKMVTIAVDEYYQNTRIQFASELPSISAGFAPNYMKMPSTTEKSWTFAAPGIAQYEFDIFLKNRDKTKSAKKVYEASKFDERAAYIAVSSAVGTTYLNIIKLDKIIEIQEEILSSRKTIYDLTLLRNKEGLSSVADTVKANKAYVAGTSDLVELKKNREKLLHQLCVLIGESPENANTLARNSLDSITFDKQIPSEISSEIIIQRPDYMKAEKMVEKAGLDVRIAKKEFLPSITLSGLALFNASNLGSLFTTKGMLWALGGSAMVPFFTGGKLKANLKLKKYQYERILQDYYKTNLVAIQEVNDALVSVKMDKEKIDLTLKQEQLEKQDYKYNEARFNQGVISKLDLIQFRENLLTIDQLLAQQKAEYMVSNIGLYKAAGSKI